MSKDSSRKLDKSSGNFKLINTGGGVRVSQACDRCRIKKIRCDGQVPCGNCGKVGFECKTSDKLTRRAFPKGYTENLEKKVQELENELKRYKLGSNPPVGNPPTNATGTAIPASTGTNTPNPSFMSHTSMENNKVVLNNNSVQINNPIDQILNLDNKGIIIGNDNLNFESQFNHLLINLNLPFLKITNSHNYLVNDPNSFLYHPSYQNYNDFHNKDLGITYNPITGHHDELLGKSSSHLPIDIYDLFIKLINNFKKIFNSKRELDNFVVQYFLNYNVFIPIFDYKQFMESYDAFHTMYPFMFTYDDATINGFNLSNNDYQVVNEYFMTVVQIYAMIMMNDPTINLNLLLNHNDPSYSKKSKENTTLIRSLYDFLPYFNVFHVSIPQLQTYLLFLYYSLLTNNKEKSSILAALCNSFIGILGINLNSKNLFFNDLALTVQQKRNRVKNFWSFKVLLKCFNLKFGFKPSLNTTVINPVTIDRYFQLTPEKLSSLLDADDDLFKVLLKPSIELLNLMNIIIPSSFSPNYYQYLKQKKDHHKKKEHHHPKHLDWILNDDDGDGNDGNLNYNFNQFLIIDKNLSEWRESLKSKTLDLLPLNQQMNLPMISQATSNNLYHDLRTSHEVELSSIISPEAMLNFNKTGTPDAFTATQLIKIQLNFHYSLIRSQNYLNFIVDKELNHNYYVEICGISREVLNYFLLIFDHIGQAPEKINDSKPRASNLVMESLGLDVDEDGFVINDFSAKRRKVSNATNLNSKRITREIPDSPFNFMLNGLSMTIISLKKSIILQMLYLLICLLKFYKRNEFTLIEHSVTLLTRTVELFMKVFINYKSNHSIKDNKKYKEDDIFKKLVNDSFKDDILKDDSDEIDEDEESFYTSIDWDDEDMDEDLKYLKILKTIQYKSEKILLKVNKKRQEQSQPVQSNTLPLVAEPQQSSGVDVRDPNVKRMPQYYEATSPNFGSYKVPSMTKLDFLLSEDHFRNHFHRLPQDDDIVKKEKMVINDLMNMKNHNWNGAYGDQSSPKQ